MLHLVGWSRLELTQQGALLPQKGMLLDLNSCIRPYAIDSVRRKLIKEGVENAMIEMAQDAVTIGKQFDVPTGYSDCVIRLEIAPPLIGSSSTEKALQCGEILNAAHDLTMKTSAGVLARSDGYPIPGMLSVSVVADSCLEACGASSVARLKTEKAAISWLENMGPALDGYDRELRCHGPLAPK